VLGNLVFTVMAYMIAAVSKTVQSAEGIAQAFNFAITFLFISGGVRRKMYVARRAPC
jgi:hypothetical protein